MYKNIVVIGGSGAIGNALLKQLIVSQAEAKIHVFSSHKITTSTQRVSYHQIDYKDEMSIVDAATIVGNDSPLDLVLVTTGILHEQNITPEKSIRDLSAEKFQYLFAANTIFPALVAKHFLFKLNKNKRAVFAALSARIGSITDNHLGGWYAYRASKAALNMIIKNAAIEIGRLNKQAIVVGLHPGTVDSKLSKPFQAHVPEGKLFTPEYSAHKLLDVIDNLTFCDSGKCIAWNGQEILP